MARLPTARLPATLLPGASLLVVLAVLVVGCAGDQGAGFRLPPVPEPGEVLPSGQPAPLLHAAGIRSGGNDEWRRVEADHEVRPALVTAPGSWSWEGEVPEGARLRFGVAGTPEAWAHAGSLTVRVSASWDGGQEVLEHVRIEDARGQEPGTGRGASKGAGSSVPTAHPAWHDVDLGLQRLAGRRATVRFEARYDSLPPELRDSPAIAWSPVRLGPAAGTAEPPAGAAAAPRAEEPSRRRGGDSGRPNVLLLVIDTLRADHLPTYGYGRNTAPHIERLLGRRGVVFENAVAQAPLTLPSVVSYWTGRQPGELLPADMARYGLPEEVPALAERFRRLGYRTAGFIANPTVHAGNGFARGFETFYSPQADTESLRLHGDSITSRAVPWLLAHADQPFFAYLHYVDPHDPYDSPLVEDNRTDWDPGYEGRVTDDWAHGLFLGRLELDDPERDLEHLVALYDEEIRYVDRQVAHVLESLPPEVLAETLVVLTADHGEEFLDHGWWKHGHTVYQEQVHVPLLVRWDGRVPPGERVAEPVALLDLVPTLMAAATGGGAGSAGSAEGGGADEEAALDEALRGSEEWDGVDLLPVLTGGLAPPRRPALSEHLASGPRRAAARLGSWKLVMFDRAEPYEPPNRMQETLYRVARERLQRLELYDLEADPGERRDLAATRPELVARLASLVVRQLDVAGRQLDGRPALRIALGAVPDGSRLEGEIGLAAPVAGWASDFLAEDDRVEVEGTTVRLSLRGEGWPKGLLLLGERGVEGDDGEATARAEAEVGPPRIRSLRFTLDGEPVPPERLSLGDGRRHGGGPVPPAVLETADWPPAVALAEGTAARSPRLFLWVPTAAAPAAGSPDAAAEETARRLRALGYIQ